MVMLPSPSSPDALYPQHSIEPPDKRAQAPLAPTEIAVAPLRPVTATGLREHG